MTKRKQTERERFEAWACKQSCLMEAEVLANIAWKSILLGNHWNFDGMAFDITVLANCS